MLRWGIIGCGSVTEAKSGPGFQNATGSALVAVMRRDAAKSEDYARRHQVPRWYSRADDLIHDPEVDIVSIATPPSSHCELALQVCAAGKPALVEKPMATCSADADRMVKAFQAAELPLFVAFYRRALPRFVKVKALLDAGAVGEVRTVCIQHLENPRPYDPADLPWRVIPEISGGGLFVDLGSHTLDLLDFLLGPISTVRGLAANQGTPHPAEDSVAMAFQLRCGAMGTGLWQFSTYEQRDRIEIHGTQGRLIFATFADEPVRLTCQGRDEWFEISNPEAIQQPLIQTIVNQMSGGRLCPSTGVSAARTVQVVESVLADYYPSLPRL